MWYLVVSFFLIGSTFASVKMDESRIDALVELNPDVQSMLKRLESSEKLKGRLTRSFLPKMSLTYGREKFTTGPYHSVSQSYGGIQAEINLFNSGKDSLESSIRDNNAEVARIDAVMMRSNIIAELKKAFSHYAYLTEIKAIIEEALGQNDFNLKSARKRINAGLASKTDLLDFQQQRIQFNQEYGTLEYEMGVTTRLINTLLGKDADAQFEFDFINSHPEHSHNEAKITLRGKSLILKKAELNKTTTKLEFQKDKRWWTPSLDLYGYAQRFTLKEREYTPASARNDVTFGLKLTLPIFDGGEGYRGAQATKSLVEAQRAKVRSQDLELQRSTLDALKKLELAHNLIHGSEENVRVIHEYRQGILSEYSKGVKNSPDVLQASQRWVDAKIRYAEVKKNYQFARAEADYLSSLQGAN